MNRFLTYFCECWARWSERIKQIPLFLRWYVGYCVFIAGCVADRAMWTCSAWWHTRAFRLLLGGLPAFITLAALPVLVLSLPSNAELALSYVRTARLAKENGDIGGTILRLERLAQLSPGQASHRYDLAMCLGSTGKHDRAKVIIESLASAEAQGFPPAHVWQARQLLNRVQVSPSEQKAAERHLSFALRQSSENVEAHALLGGLYFAQARYRDAEPHLEAALATRPDLRLSAARVYAMLGKTRLARLYGEESRRYYQEKVQADPDDLRARLRWAESALFLEDFAGAIDILQIGLASGSPDSPRAEADANLIRGLLSRCYLMWSERTAKGDLGERLRLLEHSIKHDPGNLEAVMAVWGMMRLKGDASDRARAALRTELTRGRANALIHVALGMDAWDRLENKEAIVHLEQAYSLAPQMMMVANNLAWVLAHSQPPDLERALKLIDSVIGQAPNNPVCRDTRGVILARMNRWKEALPDLQEALKAYPERAELHATLAEAYSKLGLSAMATEHTRLAERLRKKTEVKANP